MLTVLGFTTETQRLGEEKARQDEVRVVAISRVFGQLSQLRIVATAVQ
jgi:hypothetical protein